jgi:hypothetical protein
VALSVIAALLIAETEREEEEWGAGLPGAAPGYARGRSESAS